MNVTKKKIDSNKLSHLITAAYAKLLSLETWRCQTSKLDYQIFVKDIAMGT